MRLSRAPGQVLFTLCYMHALKCIEGLHGQHTGNAKLCKRVLLTYAGLWHRIDCDRGEITLSAAVEKPPQKS